MSFELFRIVITWVYRRVSSDSVRVAVTVVAAKICNAEAFSSEWTTGAV